MLACQTKGFAQIWRQLTYALRTRTHTPLCNISWFYFCKSWESGCEQVGAEIRLPYNLHAILYAGNGGIFVCYCKCTHTTNATHILHARASQRNISALMCVCVCVQVHVCVRTALIIWKVFKFMHYCHKHNWSQLCFICFLLCRCS